MPEAQQNNEQQQEDPNSNGETPELTWDTWLAQQPEEQRKVVEGLYGKQTAGLQSALRSERETRKSQEAQIRDLAGKAGKDTELQQQLTQQADALAATNRRADFYEQAVKPEHGVADLALAWLVIEKHTDDFVDKRGSVDFKLLRERHPSLFAQPKPAPKVNAGTGTQKDNTGNGNMNDFIRSAAGRRVS